MPELSDSGWIYPSFVAILSASLTAMAISFTKSSQIRLLVAVLVIIMTFEFHQSISGCLENRLWKALIITAMWLQCLQSLDNLCLTRVSYDHTITMPSKIKIQNGGNVKDKGKLGKAEITATSSTSLIKRISWGFSMLWNMRAVLTPWSIKKIPPFSANQMGFVPTRRNFLLCHFGTILLTSVLLDAFTQLPPPDFENTMAQKHQLFFSRLSQITVEEFLVRSSAVLGFWVNTACIVSLINSVFAAVHVGLGLQDPVSWPPILGRLSEAYSVRQFWGVTWHQSLRRCLTSTSEFIVCTVLHVPKGGLLSRYLKLFICFGISGLLHVVADVALGIPREESGALQFFLFTALAIMFEDGIQEITSWVFGSTPSVWHYSVGYVWVIFFMIWSVPTWAYPAARWVRPGQDVLVPFSMIQMVKGLISQNEQDR